mmetsp:Transcript_215/g.323  ORF Transcript_215/g.323 Transcript_215/m.323 type:complete len:216 (-) Transcript_215:1009-1656(-)
MISRCNTCFNSLFSSTSAPRKDLSTHVNRASCILRPTSTFTTGSHFDEFIAVDIHGTITSVKIISRSEYASLSDPTAMQSLSMPVARWSIQVSSIASGFKDEMTASMIGCTIEGTSVDSKLRDSLSSFEKLSYSFASMLFRPSIAKSSFSQSLSDIIVDIASIKFSASPNTSTANFIFVMRLSMPSFRFIISLHSSSRLPIFRSVLFTMYEDVRN